jgi:hypothetical protein
MKGGMTVVFQRDSNPISNITFTKTSSRTSLGVQAILKLGDFLEV